MALALILVVALVVIGYFLLRPRPPAAAFSPEALDLGRERLAQSGEPRIVTMTNVGELPMPVTGVTVAGEASEEFGVRADECSARSLQPERSCELRVAFSPREMGPRRAILLLHAEMPGSPAELVLTGIGIAPRLAVSRGEVRFGRQDVATTSDALEVTLTNDGTAPLEIDTVSVAGPASRDFRLTLNRCSKSALSPGESCQLRVAFGPVAAGARVAELSIACDALEPVPRVELSGEGIWTGSSFAVEPQALEFGSLLVGSQPLVKRLQVTNRQSDAVRGLGLELPDASTGFSLGSQDCRDRVLEPGRSCTVEVRFTAAAEGRFDGLLSIRHDELGTVTVGLSGRAVAPRWVLASENLGFGEIRVGQESDRRTLELRNEGSAAATIARAELRGSDGGAFEVQADGCSGKRIDPQQGCSVGLRFRPRREGEHQAVLRLSTAAGPSPPSVNLTATAVAPRLGLDREILDFGRVHRTTRSRLELSLSNRGTAPLRLRGLSVERNAEGDFEMLEGSCSAGATLRPAERCSLWLGFAPSADGRRAALLSLDHDGISGPRELPLTGIGLPPPVPELRIDTVEVDFGPQPVGERSPILTVELGAGGTGRLEFSEFSLAGPQAEEFQIVPATCHAVPSLLPGSDCAVGVRFIPSASGERRARLIIRHNAGSGVTSVALRGSGMGG